MAGCRLVRGRPWWLAGLLTIGTAILCHIGPLVGPEKLELAVQSAKSKEASNAVDHLKAHAQETIVTESINNTQPPSGNTCLIQVLGICRGNVTLNDSDWMRDDAGASSLEGCRERMRAIRAHCDNSGAIVMDYQRADEPLAMRPFEMIDKNGAIVSFEPVKLKDNHSCYNMTRGKDDNATFCYPVINIIGTQKTGTSFLYYLLTSHPDLYRAHPRKEYCIVQRTYYDYLQYFQGATRQSNHRLLVNGCIRTAETTRIHQLLRPRATLAIDIVRDVADRAWSAYNFYCDLKYEPQNCTGIEAGWAVPGIHERSPQAFRDEIFAVDAGELPAKYMIPTRQQVEHFYTAPIEHFERMTGQSVHVIANERIDNNLSGVWSDLVDALYRDTGVQLRTHPDLNELSQKRINTGNNKGTDELSEPQPEGVYAISGYQPMLGETRLLLRSWWKECPQIRERTGWSYQCSQD